MDALCPAKERSPTMPGKCVFEVENITGVHKKNVEILRELPAATGLGSGTVIVRFRHSEVPSFSPLLNIVNSQYPASYFMLYSEFAHRVGLVRKVVLEGGARTQSLNIYSEHQAQMNLLNTLGCAIEEGVRYRLYLNGALVREYPDPEACFLRDISELAPLRAALIGKAMEAQKLENDRAAFLGDIDFLQIYDGALDGKEMTEFTGQTVPDTAIRVPAGTWCSQPIQLFYPGYMGAPNYRMPSLLQTREGTLLAAIDQRMHGPLEHPNKIHIVLRRSTNLGHSFDPGIAVAKMPENSRSMDSCMVQDRDTGRIFLLTDQFPENMTLFSVSPGTGFEEAEGQICRQLLDDNGVKYLQSPGGAITCGGSPTPYTAGESCELFHNGNFVGYTLSQSCPLRVYPTSYLVLLYSDDDGRSWSAPRHLNPFVKETWMPFLGCGPGRGIQLCAGPQAGRLLFPVYYVNPQGVQCAALIYSDDHGQTWHRGESCNDRRLFEGQLFHSRTLADKRLDTNEAQAVELRDGRVLLFAKSPFSDTGRVAVAVSRDGGESFDAAVSFDPALHSTDSLSVIACGCPVDGCEALVYAGGDSVSGSSNGAVKLGLLRPGTPDRVEWRYSRLVKPGTFGHCCLSMITDRAVGLFYESSGGLDMSFLRMDLAFLKAEDRPLRPVELENAAMARDGTGTLCTLRFNQPVMLCGDRRLKVQAGRRAVAALYRGRNRDSRRYSFFAPGVQPAAVTGFSISTSMKIFAANGMCYVYSPSEKRLVWQYCGDEESVFFSLFASHIDTFDDSKRIVSSGTAWRAPGQAAESVGAGAAPYTGLRCNSEQMVQTILRYVQLNYALPLTLKELAQSINVNAAYLGRIFSGHVGQSFNDYVATYRMAQARELLKNDSLMVYEIAQAVGYTDIDHFYRLFKKHTGISPSAYRRKVLGAQ